MFRYKKYIFSIFLLILGVFFAFTILHKNNQKKYILVITNYPEKSNNYKYIKLAQKNINREYDNLIWINIDTARFKDKKYIDNIREKIKKILKTKKIIAVVDGSTSRTASVTVDLFPKDMPVIADASSPKALSKFKGNEIFTISSVPFLSRGKYIYLLAKLMRKRRIVFVLGNMSPYSEAIYNSLRLSKKLKKEKIKLIKYSEDYFRKNYQNIISKYKQNAIYVIGIDSSNKILDFISHTLEQVRNIKNLTAFSIYSSGKKEKYKNIKNTKIFAASYVGGIYPNFLEYSALKKLNTDNGLYIKKYFSVYRLYVSRINLILSTLNNKSLKKPVNKIREEILKNLKKYTKKIFVDKKYTNYLFYFKKFNINDFGIKKNMNVYYNNILSKNNGLRNMYLVTLSEKGKVFYPVQYIFMGKNQSPKLIPTLSVTGKINNISVLSLATETASIDLYLILRYIDKINGKKVALNYPKDIKILSKDEYSNKTEYTLIKTYKLGKFIYKIYKIKIFVPIHNNLFLFPYDTFYAKLEFAKDNFDSNPYFLNLKDFNYKITDSDIKIDKLIPTYAEKIIYLNPDFPLIINKNILLIKLKRKNALFVVIKYLLPAMVIMLIGLYIGYLVLKYNFEYESKGIIVDTIIGVISIYFVFSLLISIKDLVMMDIIFYIIIFILTVLVLLIIYKLKHYKKLNS